MYKLLLAAVAAIGLVGAVQAETKIAVFDAQEVLNKTNAAQRAVKLLTSKRDAAQAKIDAMEKPLIAEQEKLREQQAVMSPEKLQAAQAEFVKKLTKFRTDAQAVQNELDGENVKQRKHISETVRQAVEAIAKEKGYDLIIPKGMTFYASPAVPDISADALARANKMLDK